MKHIPSILVFILALTSCTSDIKPATFKTISVNEVFDAQITATYSKAEGDSELSNTINTNVENVIIETLSTPENKIDLKTLIQDFNTEYLKFKKNFSEESEPVWELDIESELTYQSESVISIAISIYEFKGGAHGNDQIKFLNLDAKTGRVLDLNDIIENKEEFKTLAKSHFKKTFELENSTVNMEDFFFGEPFQLPENIGYSDEGLVLLYNVYEVATYDQGYIEFVIPFEELDSILRIL
ncbi:DUF4163 domain-containing protein [Winogradskyella litoriviva]|uniref:DUF4163 domain-containing protein n=1 Tax=Winogradskyella litoriviva TaxID=1220182 RepID=A0ABX2E138_9FLAO|nr:DUF3298 and DUF4163 domain-containing protein [Winogradskyella litoriviva]NRD22035.1 DUF4163 domain-containing protein [Winogradskyella litoriviva]